MNTNPLKAVMRRIAEVLTQRLQAAQQRLMEHSVTNKLSDPIAP